MDKKLSILSIGAHPKDAIIYSGGTLAKHVAKGDRVCVVTVTHGARTHALEAVRKQIMGDANVNVAEWKPVVIQEAVDACAELGITDMRNMDYDDGVMTITPRAVRDLADIICDVRPDIVLTQWPYDSVSHHALTGQMTLLALDAAAGIQDNKKLKPHGITQLFFFSHFGMTTSLENLFPRVPTTIIDITPVIKKKATAMNKFRTQHYGEDSPLERKLGEVLDAIDGLHFRVPYAESFVAWLPQVYETLPLSEFAMKIASRPIGESFKYMTQMGLGQ